LIQYSANLTAYSIHNLCNGMYTNDSNSAKKYKHGMATRYF